ncbi:putative ATP-binding cassette transporter [Variovorax sp. YR266]|jgi:putative ATP-binding cassette transporter|uniref:cyclic peptide export ABC transporter n=1 Tax=Variovorax TaxID=34072 RepID=UPI00089B915E|nr:MULTISPECIES: cyclic peptide export ABC transporter [Variovorax]MDQ0081893.1 putative ATP-binding cassette transporter [Variovorax boronicumulans]SDZ51931.1 putative ATP-binding cassette transporter [Variovorax sp. YR266]
MTTAPAPDGEFARLLKPFLPWILLSAVTGIGAGAATVALLSTINQVLNRQGGLSGGLLLTFIGLCAVALFGRMVSDVSTNFVGQRVVAQVRKSLAQKILSAPIDALERYRTHRLMPVLSQDVDMVSDVAFALSATLIACVTALGCLAYLAYLSLPLFGVLLVALAIGATVQAMAQFRGVSGFWKAREHEDQLHKAYRAISEGAKELRMHRVRRQRMFGGQIERIVDNIRTVNGRAINTFVIAAAFGSGLFFLLIALILGWASFRPTEPAVLSGFVLVLLFLKGPMDQIAGALPAVGRARVAFRRIADLSARFATPEPHLHVGHAGSELKFEHEIALRGVRYAFDAPEGGEAFALGPIDLRLRRGEMVFVVGDNGSGKTTLIKLLLGLYAPHEGEVAIDGTPVGPERRDDYRQLFTTVFSDFYLFEDLAAGPDEEQGEASMQVLPQRALPYLERLEIAHKVSLKNGAFTTTDLSTGQRKRLALVHAYLEGRPVLVFDEWAADQDPTFRHLFYTELLPELRAKGHLLVVISHDDRYFHLADRIITMSAGRIADDRPRAHLESLAA